MNDIQTAFFQLCLLAQALQATGHYNVFTLIEGLRHMLTQNIFFYGTLVAHSPTGDPSHVFYNLKTDPLPHELVYVQLGAGYPKEMRAPHWCYVVTVNGQKLMVIPVTSIKYDSGDPHSPYEMDIIEQDGVRGRLHFDDMRSIDKMRVIEKKHYREVLTSREYIMDALDRYLKA